MTEKKFIWPDRSKLSQGGFEIVKKLRAAGFEALVAGGAVRDALLKRPISEIDIATSATPAQVKKLFAKTIPTGEKHGTMTVVYPLLVSPLARGRKQWGYEITTFRSEGIYRDNRHPSEVKFLKSAKEDAERRDFTINALFYDPEKRVVLDYVEGVADLKRKRIRLVGDPEERIREDALRMLRAVRISTILNFELEKESRRAIAKNAKLITKISAERIKQELDKIMLSDRAAIGIGVLDVVGLLEYILPELKMCKGIKQPRNQHSEGDVYTHSLLALEKLARDSDLPTRYATLFHDLGKPATRMVRAGRATFYNHQIVGAEIAGKICKRLKFSTAETDRIVWLVRNHMVPFDFPGMKLSTRRKWGLNPYFRDLLRVYLADIKASIPSIGRRSDRPPGLKQAIAILRDLDSKPALAKPLISGNDVMKVLRIEPGPQVGKVLREIDEQKLSGKLKTKNDAMNFLKMKAK